MATQDCTDRELPETFALPICDDSMAPLMAKGWKGNYSTVEWPKAGDVVLIRTQAGEHFTRDYKPLDDGNFLAVPRNPAYLTFDSRTEALTIVAVCYGCDMPRRRLARLSKR